LFKELQQTTKNGFYSADLWLLLCTHWTGKRTIIAFPTYMFSMAIKLILIIAITLGLEGRLAAQAIATTGTYKTINSSSYFRLSYENDFFAAIDEYYTQGIDAELVLPQFDGKMTRAVLLRPNYGIAQYGIGIQHNGYTPSSISSEDILYNDHPFAGVLVLKTFVNVTDSQKKQRFSSSFYAGIIGEAAGAKEMQVSIHRALNNIMPRGWQHQVRNDPAINYQVTYEKQLLGYGKYFCLSADGMANVGTINTSGAVGSTLMTGYFTSPYNSAGILRDNFSTYVYVRPQVYAVGYDATLQGGLFNDATPYRLGTENVSRFVLRNRIGVVLAYRGLNLEYFAAMSTREFGTGKPHRHGGVQLAVGF
jgi:hypothetical protein